MILKIGDLDLDLGVQIGLQTSKLQTVKHSATSNFTLNCLARI